MALILTLIRCLTVHLTTRRMSTNEVFTRIGGFCPSCGSILPPLREQGGVTCYTCSREFSFDVFKGYKVTYTVHFNSRENFKRNDKKDEDEDEGTHVDRKCPKCGNEKMAYATVQLRSADEGQTVFYTCTKCKYKESENS